LYQPETYVITLSFMVASMQGTDGRIYPWEIPGKRMRFLFPASLSRLKRSVILVNKSFGSLESFHDKNKP
jgi:hypothetical protein